MAIPISLAFLAMSLGAPAFAGDSKAANRGVKNPVVAQGPAEATLPISARQEIIDNRVMSAATSENSKGSDGPWNHVLPWLLWTLRGGIPV